MSFDSLLVKLMHPCWIKFFFFLNTPKHPKVWKTFTSRKNYSA